MNTIPWVEKYRPREFQDIVLDVYNKKILDTIIATNDIPDLLFYGPPGTGKTTTIINLINSYKVQNNIKNNDIVLHLNASDDRGIEVIRNNILQFVSSSGLFKDSMKFVILDEVDYMTKNAQQALKYLLMTKNKNIRIILICNYISKIESSVQDCLIKLQFNQLPHDNIFALLQKVCKSERLNVTSDALENIIATFKSDVRSMINYLQCNKHLLTKKYKFLNSETIHMLIDTIKTQNVELFEDKLYRVSQMFNIERIEILKRVIRECFELASVDATHLAKKMSYITHNNIYDIDILIRYTFYNVRGSFNSAFST